MSEFVHLHVHSEYSLLDGLGRVGDLVQAAAEDGGMPALALTDHGTMFASIEFVEKAKEHNIKPIVGCEVYVADRPLDERPGQDARNYHLLLLAENEAGYRNLIKLTTAAHLEGFYRKPRVDHRLLERHSEGLICLSGCASSELAARLLQNDYSGAEELANWHSEVFNGRYFLELQYHDLAMQKTINQGILHLSQKLGLPLVATNDVHYVRQRHARTHEILLCIQTQTTMGDPKRMRLETPEFYLKSPDQMQALFGEFPGAITNTLAIAERCNLELAFGRPRLPRFETPDGEASEEYLRALCEGGVRKRYGDPSPEVRGRLEYELSVIVNTGFVDYFLLVHDVIHFARSRGIAVGPGRGSDAGSIVAYCLFVTNVDPIKHGLSFERFLNPERVSMPDMDLDFADDRREEVFRYVTEKYGRDRVAQIITFGTIGPRAGVRDVGRVLSMPASDVDRVAKLVPFMCNKVARAKEEVPELRRLYEDDASIRQLLDTVEDLEGVARHASTHAAGVVIAREPLTEHVPLYKVPKNDQVVTQYSMTSVEKIGLLKVDFLGLRTLTIMQRACAFIGQSTGQTIDPDAIPLDDPSIYELLSSGETFGVFQVDGPGFRRLLRDLKPSEFNHIVAATALYRPGPMEHIPEFVSRKNGQKQVTYDHPALEEVLRETYGIVVYQDQVMRLAVRIAGYSMGEADLLRRAMGKKKPEELAKHRATFIERAGKLGTDARTAEHLFDIIEPFAGYAFNKAHAAAYAMITCQTAYLKASFPRQYLAGLLSSERENGDKVREAMAECRRLGIPVLPPDINRSSVDFTLEDDGIRFGLSAVKHVGAGVIESILATREAGGPFDSLEDFCARVDWNVVNKRVIEYLARCGAMDSLGVERGRILGSLDRVVAFGTTLFRMAAAGQVSLFGDADHPAAVLQLAVVDPASLEEKLEWEQELLGISVSRHPVVDAEARFREAGAIPVAEVSAELTSQRVAVGGLAKGVRSFAAKNGMMAKFVITDLQTTLDAVVFNRAYNAVQDQLVEGAMLVAEGRLDASDGKPCLVVDAIFGLDSAKDRPRRGNGGNHPVLEAASNGNGSRKNASDAAAVTSTVPPPARHRLTIEIARNGDRAADMEVAVRVYELILRYPGDDEVDIQIRQGGPATSVPLPHKLAGFCAELYRELVSLVGEKAVTVENLQRVR